MTLGEKRKVLFEKIKDRAFGRDGIPCHVRDERDINLSYARCPKCGQEIMDVYVSSSAEYWQNLCGREWRVQVCLGCGEEGECQLLRMN